MKIIGFNFNKISAEKTSNQIKGLKITTNIDISEIKEIESDFLKTKEELIEINFKYDVVYNTDIAKIEFKGNLIISLESKLKKDILKQWKDKTLSDELKLPLFNVILRKSNLRALQLEDEMNLPLHISLPMLRKEDKKEKKE
ncbi:MAG: hypothetical protein KKG94_02900 [Nanoarchaeota archaeon]|nr:hypothetical protein [Nanoarchaeota archaeon]